MGTFAMFFGRFSLSSDTRAWAGQQVDYFLEFGHNAFMIEADCQVFLDPNKGCSKHSELPDAPIMGELLAYCMGPSFIRPNLPIPLVHEIPTISNPRNPSMRNYFYR